MIAQANSLPKSAARDALPGQTSLVGRDTAGRAGDAARKWSGRKTLVFIIAFCGLAWSAVAVLVWLFAS